MVYDPEDHPVVFEEERCFEMKVKFWALLVIAIAFVGLGAFAIYGLSASPVIPEETQQSCGKCLSENYNLSFENPVEGFYWLEVNEQRDPEIIIMKYQIGNRCGYDCTIWDRRQEQKMIDRVIWEE